MGPLFGVIVYASCSFQYMARIRWKTVRTLTADRAMGSVFDPADETLAAAAPLRSGPSDFGNLRRAVLSTTTR
jgi:hypothetical protein